MEKSKIALFSGRAHPGLAAAVAADLGIDLGHCILENFPDREIGVQILDSVEGRHVFLLQPTGPPAADHFLELMLMADACKREGALRVTALVPYFGYSRQDRRARPGEPVGARLMVELMESRIDRLVTVDLHTPAIEGFSRIPVEHLSAIPLLAAELRSGLSPDSVLVAPDLGAAKMARRYSQFLDLPVAYVYKTRLSGSQTQVREVVGDVKDRSPVLVDDMISTGATLVSAMDAILDRGCRPQFTLAATHGLLVSDAVQQLASFPLFRLIVTDSVPQSNFRSLPAQVVSLKTILADAIRKLSPSLTQG
jgi:ribose-phosphate pyrophosphokinase